MKRIYIELLLLLFVSAGMAQSHQRSIQVSGIELHRVDQEITLKFVLIASENAVKSDYSLIVLPVLRSRNDSVVFPEIAVHGSRACIAEKRDALAVGKKKKKKLYSIKNGDRISYTATVSYKEWMQHMELVFNGVVTGCCSVKEVIIESISDITLPGHPVSVTPVKMERTVSEKQETTADRLVEKFPFLASVGSTASKDREGSLTVYFEQGKRVIDPDYKNNQRTLVELVAAVRTIEASSDSRIARVVIAGFASPEGNYLFNEQLAWDRGVALREFLKTTTSLSVEQIEVYNGAVDWRGLRKMVDASDRYDKYRILEIIDAPEWGKENRLNKLMELNGGEPYRYLLENYFPLLRNAAYVKVYYENY